MDAIISPETAWSSTMGITASAAITPERRLRPDYVTAMYKPLSQDPTPELTRGARDHLVNLLASRRPLAPGWNLASCKAIRANNLDHDVYDNRYVGSADDLQGIAREFTDALVVHGEDKKAGWGTILVTPAPLPPAALVAKGRRVIPACDATCGQLAIDLAYALAVPCILVRPDAEQPSMAILHRCATKAGAIRLSYIDRIGPSSHEYPDPMFRWTSTINGMVGHCVRQGYMAFYGHRIRELDPRLRVWTA